MSKRPQKAPSLAAASVDRGVAEGIFKRNRIPLEKREKAYLFLLELISLKRTLELSRDPKIRSPIGMARKQRKEFTELATEIDRIANRIDKLDQDRQRARKDGEPKAYIPSEGEAPFMTGVGGELSDIFSPTFLSRFGIDTPTGSERRIDPGRRARSEVTEFNIDYFNSAIRTHAHEISSSILHRIAQGLRQAEAILEAETSKGGQRPDPIREFVLLNIVAFWHSNISQSGLYFNIKKGPFTRFLIDLCGLLGVEGFATETHVENAIRQFKQMVGR